MLAGNLDILVHHLYPPSLQCHSPTAQHPVCLSLPSARSRVLAVLPGAATPRPGLCWFFPGPKEMPFFSFAPSG
jgi:hypothetical protein